MAKDKEYIPAPTLDPAEAEAVRHAAVMGEPAPALPRCERCGQPLGAGTNQCVDRFCRAVS